MTVYEISLEVVGSSLLTKQFRGQLFSPSLGIIYHNKSP